MTVTYCGTTAYYYYQAVVRVVHCMAAEAAAMPDNVNTPDIYGKNITYDPSTENEPNRSLPVDSETTSAHSGSKYFVCYWIDYIRYLDWHGQENIENGWNGLAAGSRAKFVIFQIAEFQETNGAGLTSGRIE